MVQDFDGHSVLGLKLRQLKDEAKRVAQRVKGRGIDAAGCDADDYASHILEAAWRAQLRIQGQGLDGLPAGQQYIRRAMWNQAKDFKRRANRYTQRTEAVLWPEWAAPSSYDTRLRHEVAYTLNKLRRSAAGQCLLAHALGGPGTKYRVRIWRRELRKFLDLEAVRI